MKNKGDRLSGRLAITLQGKRMQYVKGLRWKMLALMLRGTILIYVDRNVLGVLAPILKKELNFTTEQYSYVVSSFQLVYSFSQPVAGYLTDLIGPRIGYAVAAFIWGLAARLARLFDRLDLDGWLPRPARPFRGRRDADRHQDLDRVVPLRRALDRDRLVQLGLVDRRHAHAARGDLARQRLRLEIRLPAHRPAGVVFSVRLVLALSRPAEPSAPGAGRVHPNRGRADRGGRKSPRSADLRAEEFLGIDHRPLPHRAGMADLRLLDPALHGQRARHEHQGVRAVRLAAVPGLRHRLHFRRLSRAVPAQAAQPEHGQRPAHGDHDRRAVHGRTGADQLRREPDRRDPVLLARRLRPPDAVDA